MRADASFAVPVKLWALLCVFAGVTIGGNVLLTCILTGGALLYLVLQRSFRLAASYGCFYLLLALLLYGIRFHGLRMPVFSEFYVLMFWNLSPIFLVSWDLITTPPGMLSAFLSRLRMPTPQVQTIRELLDRKCLVMSCTTDKIDAMLAALARPPKLIITDSQVFRTVYDKKPAESRLTSFSVLFAQYKGDIDYYMEGANAIAQLTPESRVLIAEACTHAPLAEDIGRVKIPNMLRKRIGEGLQIDIVSGTDFPEDLASYDLIIHCGACMFNRKYVLNRIGQARTQQVPMTNYGVTIAYLAGILDKIDY